jgi:putative component of membrane protein insertase Oxa1/YidC/SpoIIIJ protein YidD
MNKDSKMVKAIIHHSLHAIATVMLCVTLCLTAPCMTAAEQLTPNSRTPKKGSTWSTTLKLFQKTVSKADGSRCPMYPSCSHYSSQAFERHNPITAWVLTADRLLRCGRDETRLSKPVFIQGQTRIKDTLADNTFWWSTP